MEKQSEFLGATQAARRHQLFSLIASDGEFYFDGRKEWNIFILTAFRFSKDLQNSFLRSNVKPIGFGAHECGDGWVSHHLVHEHQTRPKTSTGNADRIMSPQARMPVMTFLRRQADLCKDHMPHEHEHHLLYFRKVQVYESFCEECRFFHEKNPPRSSYFLRAWKDQCFSINVKKTSLLSKCRSCEELSAATRNAMDWRKNTTEIHKQKSHHVLVVMMECMNYCIKQNNARLYSAQFCSIILDGADQPSFGLPHFVTSRNDVRGRSLKARLIEVLEHLKPNKLHFFTMTEEQ